MERTFFFISFKTWIRPGWNPPSLLCPWMWLTNFLAAYLWNVMVTHLIHSVPEDGDSLSLWTLVPASCQMTEDDNLDGHHNENLCITVPVCFFFLYFNSQLHLQSVQEHSAKGVRRGTWRGAPSSAPPQVLGVKPRVLGGRKLTCWT
jgi:hypothetical protein